MIRWPLLFQLNENFSMADQTARLEAATVKAEVGSGILYRFSNDAEDADPIPTLSGNIENLKQVIDGVKANAADAVNTAVSEGIVDLSGSVLSASQSASSAESSASIAASFSHPFPTTADGLANTSGTGATNRFFSVPGTGSSLAIAYRNDSGVATVIGSAPNVVAVDEILYTLKGKASGAPRKNLFNPSDPDVSLGGFPSNTNGSIQANAAYNTTGFIPVVAGQQYTVSQKHYQCWYSVSKQFISGTSSSDTAVTKTAPASAAYMRCSAQTGANWSVFQVEKGAVQTIYEPYRFDVNLSDSVVKTQSLSDLAVSAKKTDFLKPGKNLFNKSAAAIGSFVSPTLGTMSASALYDTSDYISVTPGTAYKSSFGIRFSCYFASNGSSVVAGGIDDNTITTTSFTPPSGAAFVRVSFSHANLDVFQLEVGTVSTPYTAYGYKILGPNGEVLDPLPIGQSAVATSNLADYCVNAKKTDFLKTGKNLFSKSIATIGFFINPSTGVLAASASFDTSALIPVTSGTSYKASSGIRFSCYFAANGSTVVVGGINDSSMTTTEFTPPAGAVFVRISFSHANLDVFQVEVGTVSTAYEPYGYKILGPNGETLLGISASVVSSWSGKTWATLGDSITQQAFWQSYVVRSLGLIWTNYGIGGTKVSGAVGDVNAMCQDTRINAIPTGQDLVSIMGGTNDWAQSVAMGAADSMDPLTFNGALNTMITKIMARFPSKRVVLFTTPYGELPERTPAQGWPNTYTNSQGLTTRDYAEAVKLACKRWSLPCVDINMNAGWNTLNIRTFITDDGGLLHPNDTGGKRIAEVAIGGFKLISPV